MEKMDETLNVEEPQGAQEPVSVGDKISEQDVRHYFLCFSHGSSMSPDLLCHDLNMNFKNSKINYFTNFDTILSTEVRTGFFGTLIAGIEKHTKTNFREFANKSFVFGYTPSDLEYYNYDAFTTDYVTSDAAGNVCLPPQTFVTNPIEDDKREGLFELIGIYHFYYFAPKDKDPSDFYFYSKIEDWYYFEGTPITYSDIFKGIERYIKRIKAQPADDSDYSFINSITDSNVDFGIFTCRQFDSIYESDYPISYYSRAINKLKEVGENKYIKYVEPEKADIFSEQEMMSGLYDNHIFNIFVGELNYEQFVKNYNSWTGALAGVLTKGCALNVLSFFNIIPISYGREKTTCLSVKGTSIFKIIDYINDTYTLTNNGKYTVFRTTIENGLRIILSRFLRLAHRNRTVNHSLRSILIEGGYPEYINHLPNILSCEFTIIKLYSEHFQPNTTKHSELGHTIALGVLGNSVYYIDPQTSRYKEFLHEGIESIVQTIKNVYDGFSYCDMIGTVEEKGYTLEYFPELIHSMTVSSQIGPGESPDIVFRFRPDSVTFGGKQDDATDKKRKQTKKMRRKDNKSHSTTKKC